MPTETLATASSPQGDKVLYDVAAGVATITLNDPDTRNALSPELLGGLIAAFESAREDAEVRCVVLASSHEKTFSSGANLGGFARGRAARREALRLRALRRPVQADRRARQADRVRGARARARGRARDRARVRSDRGLRGRDVRHARDQRGHVPVHDHGADLPQRAAQEGQRAAAARRALGRAGGARGGHRQPRRARRGAGRASSPSGPASSRAKLAGDHAPRQGGDAPPARHAAGRRARLPARAAHAWRCRPRTSSRA